MNKEDVIRMAREVGLLHWYEAEGVVNEELLIKFAALVIANHPPQSSMAWQEGYSQGRLDESLESEREAHEAIEAEREACAKVADGWPDYDVEGLAEAIRARKTP